MRRIGTMLALVASFMMGSNANKPQTFTANDLLGAVLSKDTFVVEDKGTYYSVTRPLVTPNEQNPPADLVQSEDGNTENKPTGNKGYTNHK